MLGIKQADDYQPIAWVGRIPIHAATALVALHVSAMVVCALALAAGFGLNSLAFSTERALAGGAWWQFLTYPFVHVPDLWFVLEMYLLFSFGCEVEKFIGRRAFLALYGALLLATPALLAAASPLVASNAAGSRDLHFAIFIAFTTVYPNVEIFFRFRAKWVAAVLLGIATLNALAGRDLPDLLTLWGTSAIAYSWIRLLRGQAIVPLRQRFESEPAPHTRPARRRSEPPPEEMDDPMETIDPLLEKIARHGIASLTPHERARLEHARSKLIGGNER